MTPLARQLFRSSKPDVQELLAMCQFFECSKILPMAKAMAVAEAGAPFSEMSQLPAINTVLEFSDYGDRTLLICSQSDGTIWYTMYRSYNKSLFEYMRSGFVIGGLDVAGEKNGVFFLSKTPRPERNQIYCSMARWVSALLQIINQPNLIAKSSQPPHASIMKLARRALPRKVTVPGFYDCYIRQGVHSGGRGQSGAGVAFHYVRKHLRPSSGRWVEGYWRGDTSIGLHLKTYKIG